MRKGFVAIGVAGLLSLGAGAASAAVINVQFGNTGTTFGPSAHYTGSAVVGAADDLWNFAGGTFNPQYNQPGFVGWGRTIDDLALADSEGNATAATLSLTTPDAFISLEAFNPIFKGTTYAPLMDSFVFADGDRLGGGYGADGPGFVTLKGLDAGANYRLILLSAGDVIGRATLFTLNGTGKVATATGAASFIDGDTFVDFTTTADAAGTIAFSFEAAPGGREGNLNGLQLVELGRRAGIIDSPAPEPSAWALMIAGCGLSGWALRRRTAFSVS